MEYILFLMALAMVGGVWYICLVRQLRISKSSAEKAGWKTFWNLLLLIIGPIAAVGLSLFLSIQLNDESDYTNQGVGWLYVIYFMLQLIVIPAKAVFLPIMHVVTKKKEQAKNSGPGKTL